MFRQLGLQDNLLQAIESLGFTEPTPIQQKAIPVLLSGTKDFIGLAQTGTGKTAAYGFPLLQLLHVENKSPQALIVCPTRELCMQIVEDFKSYKKFSPDVFVVAVYGGASVSDQVRQIKKGVQIVVATPGRLIDLIERKAINLSQIKYVVLDEADEMLNMGFQDDIEFILKNAVNRESTWLFSATMPPEIKKVSRKYMKEPVEVSVGTVNSANVNIDHQYYITSTQHRYETLKRIIDFNPGIYGLIFTRTKIDAHAISEKLTRDGYDIDELHGDLTQAQRDKVMNAFRHRSLQLLIATDVAARGIDVEGITHVINYELPDETEVYTHRCGRTGRAGKTGICLSIVTKRDAFRIKQIEKMIKANVHKLEIPEGKDVCRKQFFFYMDKLLKMDVSSGEYESYMPMLKERFEDISKEEVLKRVAAIEFDRFLKYYENSEDLNLRDFSSDRKNGSESKFRREREEHRDTLGREFSNKEGMMKLFINLGTKDGFYKASFLQFILDMSDLKKEVLGKIDLRDTSAFLTIEKSVASKMIKSLDGKSYKGRKLRMNQAR